MNLEALLPLHIFVPRRFVGSENRGGQRLHLHLAEGTNRYSDVHERKRISNVAT